MIERRDWFVTDVLIREEEDGSIRTNGRFKADIIVDEDTGSFTIEVHFTINPDPNRKHLSKHEMLLQIRARVCNPLFLSMHIIKAATHFAVCIGAEVIKELIPVVQDAYKASHQEHGEYDFVRRTKDVVTRLNFEESKTKAKAGLRKSIRPCAAEVAVMEAVGWYIGF